MKKPAYIAWRVALGLLWLLTAPLWLPIGLLVIALGSIFEAAVETVLEWSDEYDRRKRYDEVYLSSMLMQELRTGEWYR